MWCTPDPRSAARLHRSVPRTPAGAAAHTWALRSAGPGVRAGRSWSFHTEWHTRYTTPRTPVWQVQRGEERASVAKAFAAGVAVLGSGQLERIRIRSSTSCGPRAGKPA